jgi:transketolase
MIDKLKKIANSARINTLISIYNAQSGHPGGSLSCIELMVYAFHLMSRKKTSSYSLVLSKGHAAPALYAVAAEYGFVSKNELQTFRKINSKLQGHPHVGTTSWVTTSTGSLGQGISAALGRCLGLTYNKSHEKVIVILGDGELQEGQVWECLMAIGKFQPKNLCLIVDYNKIQSDNFNVNIMNLEPLVEKFKAFNLDVKEIDGHNLDEISNAFDIFHNSRNEKSQVIIAHTIKGKGVSFMENVPSWHGSVAIRLEEIKLALAELNCSDNEISSSLQKLYF